MHADRNRNPVKIFGTRQDVTERQTLIDMLQASDNRYKQAQALAHIGNWEWNIAANKVVWTDEMFKIYELEPQSKEITFEAFLPMVPPEDVELVKNETQSSADERTKRILSPHHYSTGKN